MIIVLKPRTTKDDVSRVENMVKKRGLNTHVVQGEEMTVIGCIGDTAKVDSKLFEIDSAVDKVMHVQEVLRPTSGTFAFTRDSSVAGRDLRNSRIKYLAPIL